MCTADLFEALFEIGYVSKELLDTEQFKNLRDYADKQASSISSQITEINQEIEVSEFLARIPKELKYILTPHEVYQKIAKEIGSKFDLQVYEEIDSKRKL